MTISVAQFGLGPIGVETLRLAALKPWVKVLGGVDNDPAKKGRDLGEYTGIRSLRGLKIHGAVDDLLSAGRPDVIFHTAVSRFAVAFQQLAPIARQGINVVSSCEELVFPQLREPALARKLDLLCRKHGSRMVGTGVNPGFVMDLLPLCLTQVARAVRAIHVQRVVNASTRREPLQRKIGSGMRPEEFRRLFRKGGIGHAGLQESASLIAHTLGWTLDRLTESGDPVVAKRRIRTRFLEVQKGQTCGLHQIAKGSSRGKVRLTLDLQMYLDATDPHDAVQLDSDPPLNLVLEGGVAGDQATVAALVNTAPRLLAADPGLRLLTELPLGALTNN